MRELDSRPNKIHVHRKRSADPRGRQLREHVGVVEFTFVGDDVRVGPGGRHQVVVADKPRARGEPRRAGTEPRGGRQAGGWRRVEGVIGVLRRLCTACRQPYDPASVPRNNRSRCRPCLDEYERQKRQRRGKTTARGYGAVWQALGQRADQALPILRSVWRDAGPDRRPHRPALAWRKQRSLEPADVMQELQRDQVRSKRGADGSTTAVLEERAPLSPPFFWWSPTDPPNSPRRNKIGIRPGIKREREGDPA